MSDFIVRGYREGDEVKITELYNKVFKSTMDLSFWNWRFKANPAGATLLMLMWDGDDLIGHYAVSPVSMWISGKKEMCALSMTTMTHPRYTGRGIFPALANKLYNECSEKYGINLIWGFPNGNSHYGFIKNLNWFDIVQIPNFKLNTNKSFLNTNLVSKKIYKFKKEHYESFLNYIQNKWTFCVDRSVEYLNWRYLENPNQSYLSYEITDDNGFVNYIVAKVYQIDNDKELDILELVTGNDAEVIKSLLSACLSELNTENARFNMWMPLRDLRHLTLEKMGFSNNGHVTYLAGRSNVLGNSLDLSNSKDWYFSFGDSDVY
ncbi:MAG: GNAT family N-acetyltransferase [Bacteroidetes bacterium]|nr:GNAT family N-acetyltransferase [Bacteroidota bacterium]